MKIRTVEILQNIFLSGNQNYTIHNLAKKHNVSERSIYNDLKEINSVLSELGIPHIQTDSSGALTIDNTSTDLAKITTYLHSINVYDYHMSARERRQILILKLITADTPLSINELTQLLFVSRTTIYYDLNRIKDYLQKFHAEISFSPATGIFISCDERQARELIADIIVHEIKQLNNFTTYQQMLIDEITSDISLTAIIECVHVAELTTSSKLTEGSFTKSCLNFFIIANRFARKKTLTLFSPDIIFLKDDIEYKFTTFIFQELGIVSIAEIQSMTLDLKRYEILNMKQSTTYLNIYTVIADFLYSVSKILNVSLCNETDSFAFLVSHCENMANKSSTTFSISDTVTQEAKIEFEKQYAPIFNAVQTNISILEDYFHYSFSADDIFCITLHICAAYEKNLEKNRKLCIGIIAPGSMATAQMLSAQIENRFNLRVIKAFDRSQINGKFFELIDFVITTQKIPDLPIPNIVVNPILNVKDYEKILITSNEIRSSKAKNCNCNESTQNIFTYLTDPSRLKVNATAATWEEAIRMGGDLLKKHGDITDAYINSMINILTQFGPYHSVMPHLVFAHASPKAGAIDSGLSLVVFPEGVTFGLEEHDPIHLLFTVSEKDSKKYLEVFTKVMTLAQDPQKWKLLIHAKDEYELYNILTINDEIKGD